MSRFMNLQAPICFSDYPLEEEADAAVISTAQDLLALQLADASQVSAFYSPFWFVIDMGSVGHRCIIESRWTSSVESL